MAVLKMWDGTAWVLVSAGTPHIHDLGARPNTSFEAELGDVILAGKFWPHLGSNAYFDPQDNWSRYDVAQTAGRLQMAVTALTMAAGAAGANPISWTDRWSIDTPGGQYAQLRSIPASGGMILAGTQFTDIASNATFDGSNWNRVDTGQAAARLNISRSGLVTLYYAAAGANPIGWSSYTLTSAANPATAWAALPFATNWANLNTTTHQSGAYRRTTDGSIEVKGMVAKATALALPDNIATLPVGFRPARETEFAVGSNSLYGVVRITTVGAVDLFSGGDRVWTSLGGIRFDPVAT